MCSVTRSRMRCTEPTKSSRSLEAQTGGRVRATNSSPSAMSPATARAFRSAWNSQAFAQRS